MTLAEILEEGERLEREATKGPWEADRMGEYVFAHDGQMAVLQSRGWGYLTGTGALCLDGEHAERIQLANVQYAAFARTALPALLAVCRAAVEWEKSGTGDYTAYVAATAALRTAVRGEAPR